MPGTISDAPTVSLSFANNFWGKDDAGVDPLLQRMHSAKVTSEELKAFYNTRAAIEEEYARKLLSLCRKPLGSMETGSLRQSLDTTRGEVETMAKSHQGIAQQMKTELEEPLAAYAGGLKERRKIIQSTIEKLHKVKNQQTAVVNKTRDRYEQDCLRIKGYLAQGHMVMGQEERKNKSKMEKTQIQMASDSKEYKTAVEVLQDTTGRWNKEWKQACDKFQDLEEERIDFTKSSLWDFANLASTVCVSDDSSCEKIRLALENCEVEKDILSFINTRGTGQEIPDAPVYIDFCKGDANYSASEASDDEGGYSVAQFQRTMNPAFRTSSPAPSTFSSHHDPNSELARRMAGQDSQDNTPRAHEQTMVPDAAQPPPSQPDFRRQAAEVQEQFRQQAPPELAKVPYNENPTDGMTMFCRNDGNQSDLSSAHSPVRPGSRDSQSDYSNPTSFSSMDPPSGKASPTKAAEPSMEPPAASPTKTMHKKRSGFFSNSPFRRKSKKEERPTSFLNNSPTKSSSSRQGIQTHDFAQSPGEEHEPVDPRASFQLNVGNNVFDVASPDSRNQKQAASSRQQAPQPEVADDDDPIAAALAELRGVTKQTSTRQSADRFAGLATPAPGAGMRNNAPASSAQRGTPPPSYADTPAMKRLDAPRPAHTSAQMHATARKYAARNEEVYGNNHPRPVSRGQPAPRAASPLPPRAVSPRPGINEGAYNRAPSPNPYQGAPRQHSYNQQQPSPQQQQQRPPSQQQAYGSQGYGSAGRRPRPESASPQKTPTGSWNNRYSRHASPGDAGMHQQSPQQQVPQPQYARNDRPNSAGTMGGGGGGMALQLSQGPPMQDGGALGQGRRPQSYYGGGGQGMQMQMHAGSQGGSRERSKSVAGGAGFSKDGRPILHYARAMYSYTAAIPEELSFQKTDVLAVLRLQDDGWWEAEVTGKKGRPGLVPSNYLQRC